MHLEDRFCGSDLPPSQDQEDELTDALRHLADESEHQTADFGQDGIAVVQAGSESLLEELRSAEALAQCAGYLVGRLRSRVRGAF